MRITAFCHKTRCGQLANLELRHRRRARAEERIRTAKDTGLTNLPLHDFPQTKSGASSSRCLRAHRLDASPRSRRTPCSRWKRNGCDYDCSPSTGLIAHTSRAASYYTSPRTHPRPHSPSRPSPRYGRCPPPANRQADLRAYYAKHANPTGWTLGCWPGCRCCTPKGCAQNTGSDRERGCVGRSTALAAQRYGLSRSV